MYWMLLLNKALTLLNFLESWMWWIIDLTTSIEAKRFIKLLSHTFFICLCIVIVLPTLTEFYILNFSFDLDLFFPQVTFSFLSFVLLFLPIFLLIIIFYFFHAFVCTWICKWLHFFNLVNLSKYEYLYDLFSWNWYWYWI